MTAAPAEAHPAQARLGGSEAPGPVSEGAGEAAVVGSVSDCTGEFITLLCNGCGNVVYIPVSCRRRTCPACMKARYHRLVDAYEPLQDEFQTPVFLTLTLRRGADLAGLMERLKDAWARLRRRDLFEGVRGGFYSIEVKPPEAGKGWNVHLHAALDLAVDVDLDRNPGLLDRYLPDLCTPKAAFEPEAPCQQPEGEPDCLGHAWYDLTGDSYVVEAEPTRHPEAVVSYVLGYTADGSKVRKTWGGASEAVRREYERAVKGRRLVQTFGHLHGIGQRDRPFRCPACRGQSWTCVTFDPQLRGHIDDPPVPPPAGGSPCPA